MFKGVLFDLDGVITDTAEYHYKAWKKLADDLGITIDRKFNESLKGVSREDSLRLILEYGEMTDQITDAQFQALATEKNDNYVVMIEEFSEADVFPGILPLLKALKQHKIKIALASASKNGPILLEKMHISDYFDAIVNPASVPNGKPAPDIFIAAAESINVPVTDCIGIEDSKAGIAAIKASGVLPIGVGQAADLGSDIALVDATDKLTFDYLTTVWASKQ
ncbi:beta-phosphoglucomutase [Vagococcus penaei]|uniref:Beta-phosphoglucomutase n=1 Tax=Vagococcus penaei TaxID=633807 RepID=A0A1Q2D783_9ENTE|nr:beta-phosphoglucomutase [Vagococcus penaei]AQP54207.1 beta-phosphoglucomutase [Vagococcus penaei]RST99991.1 beta-phosphoglucomutase [Vagococcus penaei]